MKQETLRREASTQRARDRSASMRFERSSIRKGLMASMTIRRHRSSGRPSVGSHVASPVSSNCVSGTVTPAHPARSCTTYSHAPMSASSSGSEAWRPPANIDSEADCDSRPPPPNATVRASGRVWCFWLGAPLVRARQYAGARRELSAGRRAPSQQRAGAAMRDNSSTTLSSLPVIIALP